MAAAFLVVIGLVGMHHLVEVGCASVLSGHSQAHSVAATDHVAPVVDADLVVFGGSEVDAATGAGVCLAVLVFSILIFARRSAWISRDLLAKPDVRHVSRSVKRTEPPDLLILSISRT